MPSSLIQTGMVRSSWNVTAEDGLLHFFFLIFITRFLKDEASNSDKFSYVPFGAGTVQLFMYVS